MSGGSARGRVRTALLVAALMAVLGPRPCAAGQPQWWRMTDPGPSCRLLLHRRQSLGEPARPEPASERFADRLAAHKEAVRAAIARPGSMPAAAAELDRLSARFAEQSAGSPLTLPGPPSLYDPGSYHRLFEDHHDVARAMQAYEPAKRAQIQDGLTRARFRSPEDRDHFVTSRLCEIVNRYLDLLDNEQESRIDWGRLIRD